MKNNKKGISLIVLVITIIVIIILAAAVILTLNNNNPIAEANEARYRSDLANMQAVFTNVVAKIMAYNQAVVTIDPNQTDIGGNNTATLDKPEDNIVKYSIVGASNSGNAKGQIIFQGGKENVKDDNSGNGENAKWYTGKSLPRYAAGETIWSVDKDGNLNLNVNGVDYKAEGK